MGLLATLRRKGVRARELGLQTALAHLQERLALLLSYRATVRRLAWHLDRYSRRLYDAPYQEREPTGPLNLEVKLERQRTGSPFEQPTIVLLNRAVVELLQPAHRRILEIGCGTGLFASFAAQDPARYILASEFDTGSLEWAKAHRGAPNIDFGTHQLDSFTPADVDVVVAIEVIEHIADYASLLLACGRASHQLIVSTPNRQRTPFTSVDRTPAYSEHVREWNAGEFLWVLRAFYRQVELFTIPDVPGQAAALQAQPGYRPRLERCSDLTCEEELIAVCTGPISR